MKGRRDLQIRHYLIIDRDGDLREGTIGTGNGKPYERIVDHDDTSVTIEVKEGGLYLCGGMDEFRICMDGTGVESLTGV